MIFNTYLNKPSDDIFIKSIKKGNYPSFTRNAHQFNPFKTLNKTERKIIAQELVNQMPDYRKS